MGKWLVLHATERTPGQLPASRAQLTCECTALCCSRLTACPKVLPHISHANGLVPLWDRRTCTSSPCGVENTWGQVGPGRRPLRGVSGCGRWRVTGWGRRRRAEKARCAGTSPCCI